MKEQQNNLDLEFKAKNLDFQLSNATSQVFSSMKGMSNDRYNVNVINEQFDHSPMESQVFFRTQQLSEFMPVQASPMVLSKTHSR